MRFLKFSLGLLLLAPALTMPATAQMAMPKGPNASGTAASGFVEKLATDAFALLRDTSVSKAEARTRFRTMLQQNVALGDIGNRLIRRQRATLSPAQYQAYQAALPEFVLNAYAERLYNYSQATVKTVRTVPRGTMTDVYTRVSRPGSQPLDAIWQVKAGPSGKLVINNLTVSGINLSLTQEADFNAYIQQNGFDALVTRLKSANTRTATARTAA